MSLLEFFADHTYRMVFAGTLVIGVVAGTLGAFAYLRKQSLISDVISHAALPGTLLGFLVAVLVLGVDGRTMAVLLIGAVVVGVVAVAIANLVAQVTKIGIDTSMAVTLAAFFGGGMLLMSHIAGSAYPGKGGIQSYLFGNASVLTYADLWTSLVVGALALGVMTFAWKEFALRTFDPGYASALGFSGRAVDTLMFSVIVVATVIGVKAVGLVLMVAFVVSPPAAARQWTTRLGPMVLLSGAIGGVGSGVGAYLSIALGGVPTGPLIVLTLGLIVAVSLLFAPRRSIIGRAVARSRARRRLIADLGGAG